MDDVYIFDVFLCVHVMCFRVDVFSDTERVEMKAPSFYKHD